MILNKAYSILFLIFSIFVNYEAQADEVTTGYDQLPSYQFYQVPRLNPSYRAVTLPVDKKMPEECKKFIQDDGTYGEYGQMILKEITGKGKSEARPEMFFNEIPKDIEKICKDYKLFDADVRANFWVYVMAAVATNESGCKAAAVNNEAGPNGNGVAIGLFQTPKSEEGVPPTWRGRGCTQPPPYEEAESQVSCGMEIMSDLLDGQLCSTKQSQFTPFEKGSYWATLIPGNTEQGAEKINNKLDTLSIIKEFAPCRNTN